MSHMGRNGAEGQMTIVMVRRYVVPSPAADHGPDGLHIAAIGRKIARLHGASR